MREIEIFDYERYGKKDSWTLAAARAIPDGRPRFAVQILHGFCERKELWFPFMKDIAAHGGVALIHDLRDCRGFCGGENDQAPALRAYGYDRVILWDDVDRVYEAFVDAEDFECPPDPAAFDESDVPARLLRDDFGQKDPLSDVPVPDNSKEEVPPQEDPLRNNSGQEDPLPDNSKQEDPLRDDPFADPPDEPESRDAAERIPRFLLGFGMGALMAGLYAAHRDRRKKIDGLILAGFPAKNAAARPFGLAVLSLFVGGDARAAGVNRRAEARYSEPFRENGDDAPLSWISDDPEVRKAFLEDPLCCRDYTLNDHRELARLTRDFYDPASWDKPPKNFPLLLLAGGLDPAAGGDRGAAYAKRFLGDMGFSAAEARVYPGMRHVLFSGTGSGEPLADLTRFLLEHSPEADE